MAARLPLVLLLPGLAIGMAALLGLPLVAAVHLLQAGSELAVNQTLQEGNFYLVMQPDCNLVIYRSPGVDCCTNATATWATGTWKTGASGCVAAMQPDGSFVVYGLVDGAGVRTSLWAADDKPDFGRTGRPYFVRLESDGSLRIREFINETNIVVTTIRDGAQALAQPVSVGQAAPPVASSLAPATLSVADANFMFQECKLVAGSSLVNANAGIRLSLEPDCNLRICQNDATQEVLWESGSRSSLGTCELILNKDSTLLIRIQSTEQVIWKSNQSNPKKAEARFLYLKQDGTMAVYSTNHTIIWTLVISPPRSRGATAGIVGGIIGGVVGGTILLAIGLALCRALRHYGYFDGKAKKELQLRLQHKGARSRALTLWQIRKATNNNARLLGRGGFGPVYYGKLQDGQEVAIKSLSATSNQGKHEFFNERILVYEYMRGGDLRDRLHGILASVAPLSWDQRKNIILQVAEGIQYLHEGCKPAIIHRDIKTNNILLNEKMVAKVADFGLSKLLNIDMDDATHITTAVKGTTGYLDPEYYVSHKLTEKSDVYAYGVLLMEIITGRSLVDKTDHMYIVQKVRIASKSKDLDGLADPNLEGQYDHKEFSGLVKLSLWCVKQSGSDRPSMFQVVHELREIGVILPGTSHPLEDVAGEDCLGMSMPDPSETPSSSSNLKNVMSDPLISAFSISSSSSAAGGTLLLQ